MKKKIHETRRGIAYNKVIRLTKEDRRVNKIKVRYIKYEM